MENSTKKILLITLLIVVGLSTRFLFLIDGESVLPNFTAVGAVAIFGACYFKGAKRFIIPLAILWVSDLMLNNIVYTQYYDSFKIIGDPWVYISFLLAGIAAYKLLQKASWGRVVVSSLVAAVIFYLVTNFSVWLSGALYPKTFEGLMMSYEAGVPFFRNTILGNLLYSFILFGLYEYVISPIFSTKNLQLQKSF